MAAPTAQRAPAGAQEVTGSWGRVAFLSDWGAGVGGGRWSGAAVLAEYVCGAPGHALAGRRRGPGSLAGARVLELGSGTGLCGLALAAGGAAAVTVTDVRGAVPLMAANVALNGLGGRVRAEPLEWCVQLRAADWAPAVGRAMTLCGIHFESGGWWCMSTINYCSFLCMV